MKKETHYPHQLVRLDTVSDYLQAIRERHGIKTDYQLAKLLDVHRQTVYRWRDGGAAITFDEKVCLRVAELLDLEPDVVLTSMCRLRSTIPEAVTAWEKALKRAWQEAGRAGRVTGAVILGAVALAAAPTPADARTLQNQNSAADGRGIHIMRTRRRRLAGVLRQVSETVMPGRRLAL